MKMKLWVIGSLLVILLVLMTAPVSAADTGTTAVTGNPATYVAISLNQSSIYLPLNPISSPASNATLGITVTSNKAFSVVVSDNTGRGSGQGYMGNYTTSYLASPDNTILGSSIALTGTTNGTTTGVAATTPINLGSTLYTGSAAVNNQFLTPNTFSQVVTVTDVVLPGSNTYRIDLLFTISPT